VPSAQPGRFLLTLPVAKSDCDPENIADASGSLGETSHVCLCAEKADSQLGSEATSTGHAYRRFSLVGSKINVN